MNCVFSALVNPELPFYLLFLDLSQGGLTVKKLAFGTAVVLALLTMAGCAQVGKGKAPPPVVTKG
jgi:hypothetical protein